MNWLKEQWERFKEWLDSFEPCHKESLGYNCRHRIMNNGKKECGEYPNYWKGDDEY